MISKHEIKKRHDRAVKAHNQLKRRKKKAKHSWISIDQLIKKSGSHIKRRTLNKLIYKYSLVFTIILFVIFLFLRVGNSTSYPLLALIFFFLWGLVYLSCWGVLSFSLRYTIFKRRLEVEKVLPEFLQLASSNMKAGMTVDRALWEAVRPQFGVLSSEIEVVAKKTTTGVDLSKALKDFSNKYDSSLLDKTFNLIIEGLNAGGNISDLLSRISIDLQNKRLLRKELAANVMSYVLFIGFSALVMAPFLFALSASLLDVVSKVISSIDFDAASLANFPFQINDGGISIRDFTIFSYLYLIITAISSGMMISMIRKGNSKESLTYIPWFIFISVFLFWLASKGLNAIMGGVV